MADTKISALTAAGSVVAANEFAINEAGTSKKVTAAQIKTFCGGVSVQALASDATANATTTGVEITGLNRTVGPGTYVYQYYVRYQCGATTTGVKFGVNHTGSNSSFTALMRYASTGTTASTGAATMAAAGATGNIHESFSRRAMSTTSPNLGPTVSVDAANSDMLVVIEGLIIVTGSGDLELWHASEVAASSTVKAGSSLILIQTA